MKRTCLFVATAIFIFSTNAFSQGGNASITGTVTDPSGAVVSGAQIIATQHGTAVQRNALSNGSGTFTLPALPPAIYTVTVTAHGFKTFSQEIVLLADQVRGMDIHLVLGQTSQQVTVEASSVHVDTVTPVLSQVIEQARVNNLPLNGRNAADLTLLVPGAVNANGHGEQQGDTKQIPGAESISVNGARADQISYNLDGANNEDLMSNTNNPFPFPDALQEFSVQTNNFSTQYGANAGAVVNVVTKSGTNQWHGDAFEFVRNKVFNAANYFSTTGVDPQKRNQYGFTIGGPIWKDHSFVFFGYQGTRLRTQNNATNAIVPTAANLTGDFSAYLDANSPANPLHKVVQIIDPNTNLPVPGNIIPSGELSGVAQNMAKLLPISQATANGTVTFATPNDENYDEYIARFDQTLRGQDRLFVRYFYDKYVHETPYDGQDLLTVGAGSTVVSQNVAVGYTWIIKPSMVNDLVVDFERSASDRGQGGSVPQMADFGSNIWQLPKSQGGIRNFAVNGYFTIGTFTDAKFIRNTGDIRDHVTWTHGTHTISFGVDLEHDQSNIRNTDLENGSFGFTNDTTGLSLASFMFGHLRTFSQDSGDYSDSRENVIGLFAGDNWKVSQRLTLDFGLRWEPQIPMKEIYGRIQQFRPDAYAAGVQSTVVPTAPAGLFFVGDSYNGISVPATGETGDYNNFAPRVGFALDPTGTGRTVIRGGGGTFYSSRLPGLFLNDAAIIAPFSLRLDLVEPTTGPLSDPLVGYPSFVAGFPQRYTLNNVPAGVQFPALVTVYSEQPGVKWVTPVNYDWNFTVEHQLQSDMLVRASYVGTRGTHLRQDVDLNPAQYSAYVANNCAANPTAAACGTDARRYYQPFSDIIEDRNNGASSYNALQVDFEKRPNPGAIGVLKHITLLANYTLSRAMDYGLANNGGITDLGSSKGSGMNFGNPLQHAFETGLSDYNHTHRFVASFVWDLPRLNGSSRALKAVAGGWSWTGIYSYTTGDPLTILAGTDQSKTGLGLDRADFVGTANQMGVVAPEAQRGGCNTTSPCVAWLNTSLFAKPAVGTFGDAGKDTFPGPSNWDVDLGIIKNIYPVSSMENLSIQFRGDFFNIFNHPQLADPDVTLSDAAFGSIRQTVGTAAGQNLGSAADSRIIQLGLKVLF
jgi:Carboxypeptidase regulatory-like domain